MALQSAEHGAGGGAGAHAALELARGALAGRAVWLVGGLIRDRALAPERPRERARTDGAVPALAPGVPLADVDLVVRDEPRDVARALARAGAAASFALSDEVGSWRVVARDGSWQIDVEPLHGESLEADLARRDFTINAVAQTLDGAQTFDPLGGLRDLADGRLRMASAGAFAEDPLRVLRLVRHAIDLGLRPDRETLASARAAAPSLASVSGERVFGELKLILCGEDALGGLALMAETGAMGIVLPELDALRGVGQSRFHHRDVFGHTLEVLGEVLALTGSREQRATDRPPEGEGGGAPAPLAGEELRILRDALAEPLADGLTRAGALRLGALLHDAAKPLTREEAPGGRVSFAGHDVRGASLAREVLGRLRASERLRAHVAALVRHHLRLGFLVHERQPLARRAVYRYLRACGPVALDVTALSIADRLATRGERSEEAIAAHLALAQAMLRDAARWREQGPPRPLWRGDELAAALGIERGRRLGELLEELREAQFAGEVSDREGALAHTRALVARRRA
jgi:poly(A) polymerase